MTEHLKRARHAGGIWALTFCLFIASSSQAAIVENLTMGNAKALALANAVTADPPGVDSIHYNPAGLEALEGRQYNIKVLGAAMGFDVEFGGHDAITQEMIDYFGYEDEVENQTSSTSTIGLRIPFKAGVTKWPLPVLIMPLGGASYHPAGTNYTFATSVYAPMAAGYIRDDDDPGRFMGQELSLAKITYFSPTLAFQLTDEWTLGIGINFSWQGASIATRIRVPNWGLALGELLTRQLQQQDLCPDPDNPDPILNFCGLSEDIARMGPYTDAAYLQVDAETALVPGYNFGALWHPVNWFTWGFVYQAESTAHLKGSFAVQYGDEWVNFFSGVYQSDLGQFLQLLLPFPTGLSDTPYRPGYEKGEVKLDVITPQHFATGVSVQVTPRWKVNLDLKWTDWAAWEGLLLEFDHDLDFTKLATNVSPYATPNSVTFPREYESIWTWAIGLEYQYNSKLALRCGYEPRKSSIPNDKQDVLLPLGDADLIGVGFEYKMKGSQLIDFGIGYMHASADVAANESSNANSSNNYTNFIYNPYAGTEFKSNMEAILVEFSYHAPF